MDNESEISYLPSPIGFNKKHMDLKYEFIHRLLGLLNQAEELELKSYSISEDWSNNAQETVFLETSTVKLQLVLTAKKSP